MAAAADGTDPPGGDACQRYHDGSHRHETILAELPASGPDRYAVFTLEDDGSTALGADSGDFLQALRAIRTDLDAFQTWRPGR